jgi:DNA polymerase
MPRVTLDGRYDTWRRAARDLLQREQPPSTIEWLDSRAAQPGLAGLAVEEAGAPAVAPSSISVPRGFVARAVLAACHRDPNRWALLYALLWRLTHGERQLLTDDTEPDVARLGAMVRQVRRDEHRMHAFVRFREVRESDVHTRFIAWHRPDHFVVRLAAPFFVERFRTMRWSILTPDESAHWDGTELTFGPGAVVPDAPTDDRLEDLWRTYYAAMFNPARVNPGAMTRELPVRHWPTLPEATLIPSLLAKAPARVAHMIDHPGSATSARPYVTPGAGLPELRRDAAGCRGCPLHGPATQVVFGEGPPTAHLMLVGEQPGDEEDKAGAPFVGPAGAVLDRALSAAGVERAAVYLTNAVKHFSFRRDGKRRIHERPRASDVRACRPWLEAEIGRVSPAVIVCLGSTAAQSLLGPQVRIQRDRGRVFPSKWAPTVLVSYHPSAVLRADEPAHGEEIYRWLVEDLKAALAFTVRESGPEPGHDPRSPRAGVLDPRTSEAAGGPQRL